MNNTELKELSTLQAANLKSQSRQIDVLNEERNILKEKMVNQKCENDLIQDELLTERAKIKRLKPQLKIKDDQIDLLVEKFQRMKRQRDELKELNQDIRDHFSIYEKNVIIKVKCSVCRFPHVVIFDGNPSTATFAPEKK